ncbi:hypothetical protein BJX61DRAFT_364035 [Aspergillus egyptiacus]|nr:hypothetical protein BJX61DRAFT_364035 [Aspergillus egyptiacus]
MDLSSLEGPPMVDTRFSNPAHTTDVVPHIRFDYVQSPVSPLGSGSWDLPQRPASTSAIPSRNKYPSTGSDGFWQSIHPDSNSNNNDTRTLPRSHQDPSTPGPSHRTPPSSATRSSPSSRQPRTHSNSFSTPHQLVWLESEQIWLLTTHTTTNSTPSAPTHRQRPDSSLSPMFHAQRPAARAPLSHSRSMDSYSSDPEPDDLPPPYEQHMFDQPLGPVLPAVTRVPPGDVPYVRGSRWAAIGRRVG